MSQANGIPSTTITALAEEIRYLRGVASKCDVSRVELRKMAENGEGGETRRPICFDAIQYDADYRASALEQVLLWSDPQNISEALSLVVIVIGEMDSVVDKHSELSPAFSALCALARWMIRDGAKCSLPTDYYAADRLRPRDEEIAEAMTRADELAKSEAINA